MHEWTLTHNDPMAPRIAADARSGRTQVADDQTWQLRLGAPTEPAVTLETRYGGRMGLARIVPIWVLGRRQVIETQGYHAPPVLTTFAPDYLRVRADLTIALRVTYEFWVMESQAIGGRFTVHNTGDQPQSLQLDLTVQAARENQSLQLFFLSLNDGTVALQLGRMPDLQPVLLLEGAQNTGATRARLSHPVMNLPPGQSHTLRWVLGGLPSRDESLALAYKWLAAPDWNAYIGETEKNLDAVPHIETGQRDWDLTLAWSQQLILRSFLAATGQLPYPSFVNARKTSTGYTVTGTHSSGFAASWGGQSIPEALNIAGAVALSAPDLAKGLVRNFLAVQRDDGWIDARPGLDGQRTHVLAPPMLAALVHSIYRYTGDKDFLAECLDGLVGLFFRWAQSPQQDMDRDGDGVPEWSHLQQGAHEQSPTLAEGRHWAQGLDITTIEAPDLVAYLLHEGRLIMHFAELVNRPDVATDVAPLVDALALALDSMWDTDTQQFRYRDRDSHTFTTGVVVFQGKGDEALGAHTTLEEPGRLILRVSGGLSRKPRMECHIEGVDINGNHTNETVPNDGFMWYRGSGTATTTTAWRTITHLKFGGLSRVFKVEVRTVDLSRPDIALLAPLITSATGDDRATRLVNALTDPEKYWRACGLSCVPATDPQFDPAHREGPGASWPEWNTRLGLALLRRGFTAESVELFRRVIRTQAAILKQEQTFRRFWNSDTGEGMGDAEVIDGVVSVEWFAELFGAFVLDAGAVVINGLFAFEGNTMTWTQHGVQITRSDDGIDIVFPSGHTESLPPDTEQQIVRDPNTKKAPRRAPQSAPQNAPRPALEPPVPTGDVPPDDDPLPDGV